jgi:hypothetical protein
MFGPKKCDFLFVGTHTFFGRMFGLHMYKFRFLELILFWNPCLFCHYVRPEKKNEFLFFGTHTFFGNVWPENMWVPFCWNHTFFVRMRGLNMYEVAFFPGTFFFELRCCDEINVGNCQRIPFSRTLTLNNFAVQLCFCFCGSLFHFIDIIEILFLWNPFVFCQRVMLFACVL